MHSNTFNLLVVNLVMIQSILIITKRVHMSYVVITALLKDNLKFTRLEIFKMKMTILNRADFFVENACVNDGMDLKVSSKAV